MNPHRSRCKSAATSNVEAPQILEGDLQRLGFDSRELEFPFHDEVRPGESGQGYALRMATENHLNGLPQLKAWLGKSRFATLDAADAPLLHRWFGAEQRALERALGWTHTGQNSEGYVYAGHALGRSYFLNRSYPRVCFACLQSTGHCSSAWDFNLTVACAKHEAALSDTCQNCTRSISWNRPAPRTCNCYLEFAPEDESASATPLELQFAEWIEYHTRAPSMGGGPAPSKSSTHRTPAPSAPLMQLVWPLSLNGGLHVTYALATAAGYEGSLPSTEPRVRTPLRKAKQILVKANELAHRISQLQELQLRVRRPVVVIQLLADCISGGAPSADRHLAQSLLATVLHQKRKARWSGISPQLSQLSLF